MDGGDWILDFGKWMLAAFGFEFGRGFGSKREKYEGMLCNYDIDLNFSTATIL